MCNKQSFYYENQTCYLVLHQTRERERMGLIFERKKKRWMNPYYRSGFIIATLIAIALLLTGNNRHESILHHGHHNLDEQPSNQEQHGTDGGCDLFSGKWVFDNKSYPLYEESRCSFMKPDYACQKYGRKDLNYQYWRWKPHACDLPRSVSFVLFCFVLSKNLHVSQSARFRANYIRSEVARRLGPAQPEHFYTKYSCFRVDHLLALIFESYHFSPIKLG